MFLLWAGLTIAPFLSAHWGQAQVLGIRGLRAFGATSPDLVTCRVQEVPRQAPVILLTIPSTLMEFVHIHSRGQGPGFPVFLCG